MITVVKFLNHLNDDGSEFLSKTIEDYCKLHKCECYIADKDFELNQWGELTTITQINENGKVDKFPNMINFLENLVLDVSDKKINYRIFKVIFEKVKRFIKIIK